MDAGAAPGVLYVARDPAPAALGISPAAVEAAAGGAVHVAGVDLHTAAGAAFGAPPSHLFESN